MEKTNEMIVPESGPVVVNDAKLLQKELDAPIPDEAVSQRKGGGGVTLDYLEGHYVINRLNQLFGHTNWNYSVQEDSLKVVQEETEGRRSVVTYRAIVELSVPNIFASKPEHWHSRCDVSDVGFGTGMGSLGDAHENAGKTAVTDGIKRCARALGLSLGGELYDKKRKEKKERAPVGGTRRQSAPKKETGDRAKLQGTIDATCRILLERGRTKDELKGILKTKFGAEASKDLDLAKAKEFLETLKQEVRK